MLATSRIGTGDKTFAFLHGVFGRGSNWRSVARKLVEKRPGWSALLVDLRLHGDSLDVKGPHTVAAAAGDVCELSSIQAISGHSFGGKIAIEVARQIELEELWVLDCMPGPRPDRRGSEAIGQVIDALRAVGTRFDSRDAYVDALKAAGLAEPIGRWLAMSSKRVDGGFEKVVDVDAIDSMLDDYFALDLWPVLEKLTCPTHLVIAERSAVFSTDDRKRADAIARPGFEVHRIDAGHWLHVEAPNALLEKMTEMTTAS